MEQPGVLGNALVLTGTAAPLPSVGAVVLVVLAGWWAIMALAARPPRRLRAVVLATFATGIALSLLPLLPLPGLAGAAEAANRLALFGGTLAGLAILATAIIFVWTVTAALIDRL